jgi:hypothetical protein
MMMMRSVHRTKVVSDEYIPMQLCSNRPGGRTPWSADHDLNVRPLRPKFVHEAVPWS